MKKYALIGHPLGHSLSPQIHSRLFELSGTSAEYELLDIAPEKLSESFGRLSELDGFNVTIPHKVAVMDYCDITDDTAASFGSVNCVKNGDKKIGYNTDVIGFERSIEMLGASLCSRVLVIGCGGVGRMIAAQTAYKGGDVTVAVLDAFLDDAEKTVAGIKARKPDAGIKLVRISGSVLALSDLPSGEGFDLLINASPVGMFPKADALPCAPEVIERAEFMFDVIYNPKDTLLKKTAEQKGKKAMTGMAMLVLQAAAAQEIWNDSRFDGDDLKKLISDMEELV